MIEFSGEKEISRLIIRNLEKLKNNKSGNVYNVNFISTEKNIVATKDKKGNASSYKITIMVDFYLNNQSNDKNFNKKFIKETVYNSMDNKFETTYRPWPIGMYVFKNQRLKYAADPVDSSFDLLGLQTALE